MTVIIGKRLQIFISKQANIKKLLKFMASAIILTPLWRFARIWTDKNMSLKLNFVQNTSDKRVTIHSQNKPISDWAI